jgi:hypothetical protein
MAAEVINRGATLMIIAAERQPHASETFPRADELRRIMGHFHIPTGGTPKNRGGTLKNNGAFSYHRGGILKNNGNFSYHRGGTPKNNGASSYHRGGTSQKRRDGIKTQGLRQIPEPLRF